MISTEIPVVGVPPRAQEEHNRTQQRQLHDALYTAAAVLLTAYEDTDYVEPHVAFTLAHEAGAIEVGDQAYTQHTTGIGSSERLTLVAPWKDMFGGSEGTKPLTIIRSNPTAAQPTITLAGPRLYECWGTIQEAAVLPHPAARGNNSPAVRRYIQRRGSEGSRPEVSDIPLHQTGTDINRHLSVLGKFAAALESPMPHTPKESYGERRSFLSQVNLLGAWADW